MSWPTRLPLIAILRGILPEEVLSHTEALIEAGFDAVEVPLISPRWEVSIRQIATRFGSDVLVGGGTVLLPGHIDRLIDSGGKLIVTPNTRPALIAHAVQRSMYVAAGFATASEALDAIEAGAQALKLFPAQTYGPAHVSALRSVLPPIPIFAVGGITPSNLASYLRAGCIGAGLGNDLYKPGQAVAHTAQKAKAFVAAYQEGRA